MTANELLAPVARRAAECCHGVQTSERTYFVLQIGLCTAGGGDCALGVFAGRIAAYDYAEADGSVRLDIVGRDAPGSIGNGRRCLRLFHGSRLCIRRHGLVRCSRTLFRSSILCGQSVSLFDRRCGESFRLRLLDCAGVVRCLPVREHIPCCRTYTHREQQCGGAPSRTVRATTSDRPYGSRSCRVECRQECLVGCEALSAERAYAGYRQGRVGESLVSPPFVYVCCCVGAYACGAGDKVD